MPSGDLPAAGFRPEAYRTAASGEASRLMAFTGRKRASQLRGQEQRQLLLAEIQIRTDDGRWMPV
jgi:hypothetical protein